MSDMMGPTQALLAVAVAGPAILCVDAAPAPSEFDGDGRSDILLWNAATSEDYVYFMGKAFDVESVVGRMSRRSARFTGRKTKRYGWLPRKVTAPTSDAR